MPYFMNTPSSYQIFTSYCIDYKCVIWWPFKIPVKIELHSKQFAQIDMEPHSDMDEISYLIHLEAYKRFKDEEAHLRRMVEEKTKQYNEVKTEYLNLYAKYVEVLKLCAAREALQTGQFQDADSIEQAAKSIETIARKTSIDQQVEFLQTHILRLAKEVLAKTPDFKNLPELRHSTANNKNRVDFIQSSLARVESKLETAVASGLDAFVKRIEE